MRRRSLNETDPHDFFRMAATVEASKGAINGRSGGRARKSEKRETLGKKRVGEMVSPEIGIRKNIWERNEDDGILHNRRLSRRVR